MDDSNSISLAIIIVGFCFSFALASFAPDPKAQRISACVSQPGMLYNVYEGCVPIPQHKEGNEQ